MKKIIYLVIIFVYFANIAIADSRRGVAIVGQGSISCEEYLTGVSNNDMNTDVLVYTWIQGYMNGINTVMWLQTHDGNAPVDLNIISISEQISFIKSFCKKNKDSLIHQAAGELMDEMMKKQDAKKRKSDLSKLFSSRFFYEC